jgi:hypothetical protein
MGFFSQIFGSKPTVPELPTLQSAQQTSMRSTQAALPQIKEIGSAVNMFNQEQLTALMEKSFPGANQKAQSAISAMLSGELPPDVLRNLRRSAAERGLKAGTVGGGFQLGRELSDQLGMSLQLTQQGLQSAQSWLAQSTAKPTFDVTSMFISPQMQYQANTDQFNRQFAINKIKAAPNPVAAGLFNTTVQLASAAIGGFTGGLGLVKGLAGAAVSGAASGAARGATSSMMTPTAAPAGTGNFGSSMRAPTAGFGNFYG